MFIINGFILLRIEIKKRTKKKPNLEKVGVLNKTK
jgi:hypothetical protein